MAAIAALQSSMTSLSLSSNSFLGQRFPPFSVSSSPVKPTKQQCLIVMKEKNLVSRVGHKIFEDGKQVRYLVKTGEIIDGAKNWKKQKERKEKTEVATTS